MYICAYVYVYMYICAYAYYYKHHFSRYWGYVSEKSRVKSLFLWSI